MRDSYWSPLPLRAIGVVPGSASAGCVVFEDAVGHAAPANGPANLSVGRAAPANGPEKGSLWHRGGKPPWRVVFEDLRVRHAFVTTCCALRRSVESLRSECGIKDEQLSKERNPGGHEPCQSAARLSIIGTRGTDNPLGIMVASPGQK